MTVKYQSARLRHIDSNGIESWQSIMPHKIQERPERGDLICIGCQTWMTWQRSFTNQHGTEVPAILRLWKGHQHEVDCKLNLDTLQADLYKAHPEVISLENKVLYLHLPNEEQQKARQPATTGGHHRNNAELWTQTMHSATAIARFLRNFDDPDDLLKRLMIRYRDPNNDIKTMFWADFCFHADSPQAGQYLHRLRGKHPQTKAAPVAVIFPVKQDPKLNHKGTQRFFRIKTGQHVHIDNEQQTLMLSLAEYLTVTRSRLERYKPGSTVIVLGHGHEFGWPATADPIREIRIQIRESWQIAEL
ncbi:hypothetical protein G7066_08715 [Leucobacter coleopterorum]|uniref:Uncharacterized protein n=1 Tax=Leucobacter coleopterorum TaxID=2714933 RepID=A0ABX6JWJ4_9MICO|nr:hypothetical protein [Leucobacter coleopterorum]QIM18672.1 hypothetical protein G7066_08715 [Leucobacter coleopterorum]